MAVLSVLQYFGHWIWPIQKWKLQLNLYLIETHKYHYKAELILNHLISSILSAHIHKCIWYLLLDQSGSFRMVLQTTRRSGNIFLSASVLKSDKKVLELCFNQLILSGIILVSRRYPIAVWLLYWLQQKHWHFDTQIQKCRGSCVDRYCIHKW